MRRRGAIRFGLAIWICCVCVHCIRQSLMFDRGARRFVIVVVSHILAMAIFILFAIYNKHHCRDLGGRQSSSGTGENVWHKNDKKVTA